MPFQASTDSLVVGPPMSKKLTLTFNPAYIGDFQSDMHGFRRRLLAT